MTFRQVRLWSFVVGVFLLLTAALRGQQKPQWMPGQIGLNAGLLPAPGFTYVNITIDYDASAYIGSSGSPVPVNGKYNVWAVENLFYGVLDTKILGATPGFMMVITPATGSLDADIQFPNTGIPDLGASSGGAGLADLFIEPFALGWHAKRADIQVGEAVMVPTGRYTPGASDNVGSGYFGNHLLTGATVYITKNKGTSANLFTDWEVHGGRQGTNGTDKTPGQAFTDEWGLGQVLPLKKNMTQLLQLGVIGYDQWQVTANGGTAPLPFTGRPVPAGLLPFYSVHAVGGQVTYIAPLKNLSLNAKGEHEYKGVNHTEGNTIVFGGAWTFRIPRPVSGRK